MRLIHLPAWIWLLWVHLPGLSADALGAVPAKGGVVIVGSATSASDEFAQAFEYVTVETYGLTSTFKFADGSVRKWQPPQLRRIVPYPDYAQLTLVSDEQWQELENLALAAAETARMYPKSAPFVTPVVGQINSALAKRHQGNVVVAGRWMSLQDYERSHADAKVDYLDQLDLAGKVYKNVRVSAVKDLQVKLMHDGGFTTVPLEDLKKQPEGKRKGLAKTNPRLAPLFGFTAEESGASAGSLAASQTAAPAALSFVISRGVVTITEMGGSKQFPVGRVPQHYLDADEGLSRAVSRALEKSGVKP
jgi:hypothetical protein